MNKGLTDEDTKLMQEDLYAILGVEGTATLEDIQRSWRRKCLKCHPDKYKNDDAKAAEFLHLTKILDFLSDATKRKAYDNKLQARARERKRKANLDTTTRNLRDQLDQRERAAKRQKRAEEDARIDLAAEIYRLREEGLRQLEEENRKRQQQADDAQRIQRAAECKLIICWKDSEASDDQSTPSEARLRSILQAYGNTKEFLLKKKKAIVEFPDPESAYRAYLGLTDHPVYAFTVKSVAGEATMEQKYAHVRAEGQSTIRFDRKKEHSQNTVNEDASSHQQMLDSHLDFEAQILAQMMEYQHEETA